jgi:hypothetical protein
LPVQAFSEELKEMRNVFLMKVGMVSSLIFGLAACSVDTPNNYQTQVPADYQAVDQTLPAWSEFSPKLDEKHEMVGTPEIQNVIESGEKLSCRTRRFDLTTNPTEIVTYNPDMGSFWVGSLLQGKGYKAGIGSLRELPIRQRTPITLFVNRFGGSTTKTVSLPNAATVQQGISDIIVELQNSKIPVSTDVSFESKRQYSLEQSLLEAGISAKFLGSSVKIRAKHVHHRNGTTTNPSFSIQFGFDPDSS